MKRQFISVMAAMMIVFGVMYVWNWIASTQNGPDTFMIASVTVPDHKQGEDPTVSYTREIFREMRGFWTVEVRRVDQEGEQCHGTGAAIYSPREHKKLPLPLSVFSGVRCALQPGQYIMATRWDLTDDRGGSAVVLNVTEPFTVSAN